MNENEFQFRTAAFGGFHKQDVLDYLERSAQENAQRLAALQRELSGEKVARTGEAERLAALEEENRRLAVQLAELKERLTQASTERDELRTLNDQLQDQLDKVTPAAIAYEAVKDRTASIELEAHVRAQAIEQEGRVKAEKCQQQVKEWFAKIKEAYERLRFDMTATMGRAVLELERTSETIKGISEDMDSQDSALDAIGAQIEALDSAKVPAPLSLDGKE